MPTSEGNVCASGAVASPTSTRQDRTKARSALIQSVREEPSRRSSHRMMVISGWGRDSPAGALSALEGADTAEMVIALLVSGARRVAALFSTSPGRLHEGAGVSVSG